MECKRPHAMNPSSRRLFLFCFFFNDTATTEIYTLSLHDALPIYIPCVGDRSRLSSDYLSAGWQPRSEEHTSELQSLRHLVCRLLLEKKKKIKPFLTLFSNLNYYNTLVDTTRRT